MAMKKKSTKNVSGSVPQSDVQGMVIAADRAFEAQDWKGSLSLYRLLSMSFPQEMSLLLKICICQINLAQDVSSSLETLKRKAPSMAGMAMTAWAESSCKEKHYGLALEQIEQAIGLAPKHWPAYVLKARILQEQGLLQAAALCLDVAKGMSDHPIIVRQQGLVYEALGQYEDVVRVYEALLQKQPGVYEIRIALAEMYDRMNLLDKALVHIDEALRMAGKISPTALSTWSHISFRSARWQGLDQVLPFVRDGLRAGTCLVNPLTLLVLPASAEDQLLATRRMSQLFFAADPVMPQPAVADKIRIAYVSSDFGQHPVTRLTAGVYGLHDRSRFEVYLVSTSPRPEDEAKRRLIQSSDYFIEAEASDVTDAVLIQALRERDIHIAVDLNGHTAGHRLQAFAQRIAPIQVNYLGFPGSSGASFMDYIIADEQVLPPSIQSAFSEQVVHLPQFQVNDDQRVRPPASTRAQHDWPADKVLFACFNNTYKLNPTMFTAWMEILRRAESSVLCLLGKDTVVEKHLRQQAQAAGIDPQRLIFAGGMDYEAHLARYALVDVALDTLPFNGGSTSSDALWMGVPILTYPGETFAGRMSLSLLHSMGLHELIAKDLESYIEIGVRLACEPDFLAEVKAKVADPERRAVIFNTEAWVRHAEAAFQVMYDRWRQGEAPCPIRVR